MASLAASDKPEGAYPKSPDAKNVKITPDEWKKVGKERLTPRQLDALLGKAFAKDKLQPSGLISDEEFIRRVSIDLVGKLPLPADVQEFILDQNKAKRSELVDKLLATEDFSRRWARYWHDVIVSRATDERIKRGGQTRLFEEWLFDQFQAKKSWGEIASAMITATGALHYDGSSPPESGAAMFLMCHSGNEAAVERAAETSRVFMGIQIQCAQCHDHPTDIWKRNQFHELSAYYSRTRERPVRDGQRIKGFELVGLPRGEHQMPGLEDPKKTTLTHPRFLTGGDSRRGQSDEVRRKELATLVTSKDNYWFSAAYANRTWAELMGQGFYQPVDNMGPLQQATYPDVLLALAASFRNSDYDVRDTFRLICNTEAYQRQARLGETADQHLHFTGSYPTRLPAATMWEALVNVLGPLQGPQPPRPPQGPGARFANRFGMERQFKDAFDFDPSTKSDEVEGSIPQALLLMNNPAINGLIRAEGNTLLARLLKAYDDDDDAIKMLYLRTLARKPTQRERATAKGHVKEVGKRGEAFEDLLWALINSTEFQTKK